MTQLSDLPEKPTLDEQIAWWRRNRNINRMFFPEEVRQGEAILASLESLQAALTRAQAAEKDAGRYQYLQQRFQATLIIAFFGNGATNRYIKDVDAAIDATIAAQSDAKKEGL